MNTLATLFKKIADSATVNDYVSFQHYAESLLLLLDTRYPELLEQQDTDFLDAYTQIIDYKVSGSFTIEKDEAVALIGKLAFREDMKEKTCESDDSQV